MTEFNSDFMRTAIRHYAQNIEIPQFDERSIRIRTEKRRPSLRIRQRVAIGVTAAAFVAGVALNGHAVVAQVRQMMRAALTIGGAPVPTLVRTATFEEAQKDMPFRVVAAPGIPGYQQAVREIVARTSPQLSRLVIQYTDASSPAITITESSTNSAGANVRFWMSKASLPAPAGAEPRQRSVRLTLQSWTVEGTRIDLMSPPGTLTTAQMLAIQRAMSR